MSDPAPTMLLTYAYRLNPTRVQHRALEAILEQQRQLTNAALEERILAWEKGVSITEAQQSRSLTQIRADDPAFAGVQRRIQRETLRRLDRAYKAFFRRAKAGAGASSGFPRFKGREQFDGFGFDAFLQIKWDGKRLRFAGMPGGLRVHLDRPLPEVADPDTGELRPVIKGIWFKRQGGLWRVGFQAETPIAADRRGLGRGAVGVDWGTSVLAALSTGEMISNPRPGEAAAGVLARAQRAVARCKKGSRGRSKARRHLQAVQRATANRRRNRMDKLAKRLVTDFQMVAIEDLQVSRMMDAERPGETLPGFVKSRRNREALDAAPYMLRQMLAYKARRFRADLRLVDPQHTTQQCFFCGGLHFKELADTEHRCTAPGLFFGRVVPRKVNAARVILQRALYDGGRPLPGGLDGVLSETSLRHDAAARNARTGARRPGNTGEARASPGWRPEQSGSSPLPAVPAARTGARDPRTKRSPGW